MRISYVHYLALAAAVLLVTVGVVFFVPRIEAVLPVIVHRAEPSPTPLRLLFAGDAMFDRTVRREGEKWGYASTIDAFDPLFKEHDLIIMNLEGPITAHASLSLDSRIGDPHNTRFTFHPAVAKVLSERGIVVHLGNNHIWDFGPDGIASTVSTLTDAGVSYFGDSGGATKPSLVWEREGLRIGLVSYNEFSGGSAVRAEEELHRLNGVVDLLVLYAHWGVEYEPQPTADQRLLARRFVQAGADLVVGSHPHVVQTEEVYQGSPIYYSLGNFVFDQYWIPEVRCGAVLSVLVKDGALVTWDIQPVRLETTRRSWPGACI